MPENEDKILDRSLKKSSRESLYIVLVIICLALLVITEFFGEKILYTLGVRESLLNQMCRVSISRLLGFFVLFMVVTYSGYDITKDAEGKFWREYCFLCRALRFP